MKKLLSILPLIFIWGHLYADTPLVPQQLGPFSGLNNQDNPVVIPSQNAQDLLNVNITPGGRSVQRRSGYGVDTTFATSTSPVHGGYHFYDGNGNDIRLWGTDTKVYSSKNNGSYSAIVSTLTVNATLQCSDAGGFAYCVDSARDFMFQTDGTAVTWQNVNSAPQGSIITASASRLVVAGVPSTPSTLYFSGQGAYTNWTLGSVVSSPFNENILAPGSHITHLRYAFGRYLWWKDQSFGYIVGDDQTSVQIVVVSYLVGTLDNSSVENEGIVYFRGQDNHIWAYDGANLTRLTREITPITNLSNTRKSNQWNQQSQSDFNGGAYSSTTYSTVFTGVILSPNNANIPQNSFEGAGLTSWTLGIHWNQQSGGFVGTSCTINPANGSWNIFFGVSGDAFTTMVAELDASPSGTLLSSMTVTNANNACTNVTRTIQAVPSAARTLATLKFYPANIPGDVTTSSAFLYSGSTLTFTTASVFYPTAANTVMAIDFVQGGLDNNTGSGIYYSAVNNAPALTGWDIFQANTLTNGGTHQFSVRSATNPFTVLSATPTWVAQTAGSAITASTGTYFQMEDTFTVTVASQNPVLQSFTFNWFEGSAADKAYATYFDFGIWWSVSYGASATTNNRILRYDLLNQTWTIYDIPVNGFLVQNNKLYFGSPSSGTTYVFGSQDSDNGSAINAYWKSKDFSNVGSDVYRGYQPNDTPFNRKDYRTLSIFASNQSTGTLNISYTTDRSTTGTYAINLTDTLGLGVLHSNYNLPFGTKGYTINMQFGNNAANQPWEVFGGILTYNPGTWYVYTP